MAIGKKVSWFQNFKVSNTLKHCNLENSETLNFRCRLKRRFIGYYYHEGVARSGRPLRASDQALESQDEGIHLWRAQRDLHHRPAEDAEDVQRGVEVCAGSG